MISLLYCDILNKHANNEVPKISKKNIISNSFTKVCANLPNDSNYINYVLKGISTRQIFSVCTKFVFQGKIELARQILR